MGSGGATRRSLIGLALALALVPVAALACDPDRIELRWPEGRAAFAVELVDDPDERARGLMFRESLALSAGMLFVYERPGRVSFWMKNTLIPLDMIFADATGRVTRVHADARPGDLSPIEGGENVQYVLEINGGLARRLGIAAGAEMRHPAIAPSVAAWPCGE